MSSFSRRAFIAGSTGALAFASRPVGVLAAECLSSYVPARLTVDCASRRNFATFAQNSKFVGLAGAVSMTTVVGKFGKYTAGNLFLFPWLKPGGAALGLKAYYPVAATRVALSAPLPRASVADEIFCGNVIQAPRSKFIGVIIDVPYDPDRAKTPRFTNVALPSGQSVGINWTSSNLNDPYFAGSRLIPSDGLCNGGAWRKLIVDGLNQASAGVCA